MGIYRISHAVVWDVGVEPTLIDFLYDHLPDRWGVNWGLFGKTSPVYYCY
jgi:hypothetical protein